MHINDISAGDIVTYRTPSHPGKKHYGIVVEFAPDGPAVHNPEQWMKVKWLGGDGPFLHAWDLINYTTTLVEKYKCIRKKKQRKRSKVKNGKC
jgi:hypothetical protein